MTIPPQDNSAERSRRNFLKTTVAATGAVATSGLVIPRVHAQGSDIIKVGLVGCGGRGRGAILNALKADYRARCTALADAFPDALEFAKKTLPNQAKDQFAVDDDHCFSGIDAYKQLIPEVDVVLLCSPPHFRPAHLEEAIKAGKHVFCEKPVAVDPTGVRKVLEAAKLAEEKKLNLVSGLCWRYDVGVKETIQRIKDGAIGEIINTQENYLTGTLWQKTRKPEWSDMEFQLRNWLYFCWLSGDHINEQFIHTAWINRCGCGTTCRPSMLMAWVDARCGPAKSTAMSTTTSQWFTNGRTVRVLSLTLGRWPDV